MTTAAQPPSDTPRTDAAMCVLHPGVQPSVWYVQATVCREIERNLAAAQATIARQAEELERVRKDADATVYAAVERVLDEHSAWIASPNKAVTKAIALAVGMTAFRVTHEDTERLNWLDEQCSEGNGRHLCCLPGALRKAIDSAIAKERS